MLLIIDFIRFVQRAINRLFLELPKNVAEKTKH